MSAMEKKVLFGATQEAVLSPKEGYEVESVRVFNKTTNEVVPSQLTKTSDNPPQWTCTFYQPAGVVAIQPVMRPIVYSVIIEECENCSIVLMESNDVVAIKMAAVNQDADAAEDTPVEDEGVDDEAPVVGGSAGSVEENPAVVGDAQPLEPQETPREPAAEEEENGLPGDGDALPAASEGEGAAGNFNEPQHSLNDDGGAEEVSDVEGNGGADEDSGNGDEDSGNGNDENGDEVYPAGEFAEELELREPVKMRREDYDNKCKAYWHYKRQRLAGHISQEFFDGVEKAHMEMLDDVSEGRIVIIDPQ